MVHPVEDSRAFLQLGLFTRTPTREFAQAPVAQDQMHRGTLSFGEVDTLSAYVEATAPGLALIQLRQKAIRDNVFLKHNVFLGMTAPSDGGVTVSQALQIRRLDNRGMPTQGAHFTNFHIPGFGWAHLEKITSTSHFGSLQLVADRNKHGMDLGRRLSGPFQKVLQGAEVLSLVEKAAFQFIDEPLVLNRKEVFKFRLDEDHTIKLDEVSVDPPVELGVNRLKMQEPDYITSYEVRVSDMPALNADIPKSNVRTVTELSKTIPPGAVGVLASKIGRNFGMLEHRPGQYVVVTWHGGMLIQDSRAGTVFIPRSPTQSNSTDIHDGLQFAEARLLMIAD